MTLRRPRPETTEWHFRFPPLRDELLSSWLVRVGNAYRRPAQAVVYAITGRPYGQLTFPEASIGADCLALLASTLRVEHSRLQKASLANWAEYLGSSLTAIRPRWLVSAKRKRRLGSIARPVHYCPMCLQEDEKPYFRRAWILAFVVACPRHKLLLSQRCPHCKTQNYYTGTWAGPAAVLANTSPANCLSCGRDLRKQRASSRVNEDRFPYLIAFQTALVESSNHAQPRRGRTIRALLDFLAIRIS